MRPLSLEDAEAHDGNLRTKYDTIIIPDQPRAAILNGHRPGTMPPEYTGGLGAEGVKALREFVEQGGTLVCLNRASDFAIEQFKLPIRDVVDGLPRTDFYVPGSILRIELDPTDPIAKGMPKESIAWAENSPVFEIKSDPLALLRVKIIARYPSDKDPSAFRLAVGRRSHQRQSRVGRSWHGQRPHHSFRLPPAVPRPIAGNLSAVLQCDQRQVGPRPSRFHCHFSWID